jgi:hypothetical protein
VGWKKCSARSRGGVFSHPLRWSVLKWRTSCTAGKALGCRALFPIFVGSWSYKCIRIQHTLLFRGFAQRGFACSWKNFCFNICTSRRRQPRTTLINRYLHILSIVFPVSLFSLTPFFHKVLTSHIAALPFARGFQWRDPCQRRGSACTRVNLEIWFLMVGSTASIIVHCFVLRWRY